MNPKNTWLWLIMAAALLGGIFAYERFAPKEEATSLKLLPGLNTNAVISVEIIPASDRAILAARTNGGWHLREPVVYPANSSGVGSFLAALEGLVPATRISAQELTGAGDIDAKFGFRPPQTTIVLQPGDQHIQIGNKTSPGDQVFIKIIGMEGVFVADIAFLKTLPRSVDDWRERALADISQLNFDRIAVTNGGKVMELQRGTNHLWRMISPIVARAGAEKIAASLNSLQRLRATKFVSDGPAADLDSFGLQTPELSLAFKRGTNLTLLLAFGKIATNDATQIYVRRNDEKTVTTVAKELVEPWHAPHEAFRDHRLVSPTGPLSQIEIHALEDFSLVRTNNRWFVAPQNFPADDELVTLLLGRLSGMQIVQFAQDYLTAQDLGEKGLVAPWYRIILRAAVTNSVTGLTNVPVSEISFGTNQNDLIFARRADESFLYSIRMADFEPLPKRALQMRERRIWGFTEDDVSRVKLEQNGKTWEIDRKGTNQWSLAPGSQGILNEFALEETVHRLGELEAESWIQRGDQNREQYGFKADGHRITLDLKSGQKLMVELGGSAGITTYGLATVDNEPWIFELPPVLNQFVQLYLTIPPGIP